MRIGKYSITQQNDGSYLARWRDKSGERIVPINFEKFLSSILPGDIQDTAKCIELFIKSITNLKDFLEEESAIIERFPRDVDETEGNINGWTFEQMSKWHLLVWHLHYFVEAYNAVYGTSVDASEIIEEHSQELEAYMHLHTLQVGLAISGSDGYISCSL